MSITSELNKLNTNLVNAYNVINTRGGKLPELQNFDNLAESINSIPNFTLMGNELRKACAYTHTDNISNQCRIVYKSNDNQDDAKFSSYFTATNCEISGGYVIIDGKLFKIVTNDDQLTLEQVGSDENWSKLCEGGFFLKNNYTEIYSWRDYNTPLFTGTNIQCSRNYFISNGNLYKIIHSSSSGFYPSSCQLIESSGLWTSIKANDFDYAVGIRNNQLTYYNKSTEAFEVIYDKNVDVYYISTNYGNASNTYFGVGSGSTLIKWKYNNNKTTINCADTIVYLTESISSNSNIFYVLQNNYLLVNKGISDVDLYSESLEWYKKNNKLYKVSYAYVNDGNAFEVNIDATNIIDIYCSYRSNYCIVRYGEDSSAKETVYSTKLDNKEKIYNSVSSLEGTTTFTEDAPDVITIDNKEYLRDTTKDSVFEFVPDELNNHTFTDTELCQAYLNAGLKEV